MRSWFVAIVVAILLGSASAGTALASEERLPARSDASSWERLQRVRAALQPNRSAPVQLDRLQGRAAPASLSLLVVGCDFSDSLMVGRDRSAFPGWPAPRRTAQPIPGTDIPIFAAHDSTFFDLQMQRVDDYFRTVSFGNFSLQWDVHPEIVNLPEPMGYYGDADSATVRAVRMARQVVEAIDAGVDFSGYDTLVLIHAGAGQETDLNGDSPEQIFSNYLDRRDFEEAVEAGALASPVLPTGEIDLEHVLVLPEAQAQDPPEGNPRGGFFDVRGVYAFEVGLRLGMLSLADFTPGNFPDSQGIGNFGLMGYGLFVGLGIVPSAPCAMNRALMGWVEPVEVDSTADLRIGAMDEVGAAVADTLLVRVPINDREYWLVEYRLQDPDGDLFYGFDDLNGNVFPDYYDADSEFGNGWPTSTYDPAVDTWERELGAEWDWFMSENPVRSPDRCERAGGSGLYVWHVDERVIEDALLAGTNTINADPERKGVDVEEADGIQDLDSPAPSPYLLGSDADTWRGEGASTFGPDTLPSTRTNDGLPTGIRITDISTVVAESLGRDEDGFCTGFVYRPALEFRVEFGVAAPVGPREAARMRLTGRAPLHDLRLADLGTSAVDATADDRAEIVAVTDSGRVEVYRGDLTEWLDGDADPSTRGPLTTLRPASGWNGPPAIGDVDADGSPDLLLASAERLYVLSSRDGRALLAPGGDPLGPFAEAEAGREFVGPVLLSEDGTRALVLERGPSETAPVEIEFGGPVPVRRRAILDGEAVLGPVALDADLGRWAVLHTGTDGSALSLWDRDSDSWERLASGEGSAAGGLLAFASDQGRALVWPDSTGHLWSYVEPGAVGERTLDRGLPVSTASAASSRVAGQGGVPVVAASSGGRLLVMDMGLRSRAGFPFVPERNGSNPSLGPRAVAPALVDLDGDGRVDLLWHEPAGALWAIDLDGRVLDGWPVAGPAEPVSTPAVADVDGDGLLELVVAGRFERLVAVDAPTRSFVSEIVGEIRVYDLDTPSSGTHAPWAQGGGGQGNLAFAALEALASGSGDLARGDVEVRPNPARGDFVRVRARVPGGGQVEATLYTLEGEEIVSVGPVMVLPGSAFEEDLSIAGLSPGLYVCRVRADDGGSVLRVVTVVR